MAKIRDVKKNCFNFDKVLIENPIKTEKNETTAEIEQLLNKRPFEEVNIKEEYDYVEENRSVFSFTDPTNVKMEKIEEMTEIPEIPEITFDDLAVKNEELFIKEEVSNLNESRNLSPNLSQREPKNTDSRTSSGNHIPCTNGKKVKKFKCELCSFQTIQKKHLNNHLLQHQNPEDLLNGILKDPATSQTDKNKFKCLDCNYEAVNKSILKRDPLSHKPMDEVEIFKCKECYFETKYKSTIRIHLQRHQEKRLVKLKCDDCDYQTHYKGHLKNHLLMHQNPEDKNKYKCDQCDFKSFKDAKLQRHLLRHKSTNEIEMFKCNECCFQTRFQNSMKAHFHRHKREKLVVHKCTKCDYQTNKAFDIRIHLLVHENEQTNYIAGLKNI